MDKEFLPNEKILPAGTLVFATTSIALAQRIDKYASEHYPATFKLETVQDGYTTIFELSATLPIEETLVIGLKKIIYGIGARLVLEEEENK